MGNLNNSEYSVWIPEFRILVKKYIFGKFRNAGRHDLQNISIKFKLDPYVKPV